MRGGWKKELDDEYFNSPIFSSPSKDFTLEEILSEEDVLQECKDDKGPLLD